MARRSKRNRPALMKADETFSFGPFRMARFGNRILWDKKVTEAQHQQITKHLSDSLEEVKADLDVKVARLVENIRRHQPLHLLRCAYSMFAQAALGKKSEPEWTSEDGATCWTIEYIFSVVASTPLEQFGNEPVGQADYHAIFQDVLGLVQGITLSFSIASTARRQVEGLVTEEGYEELYTRCVMHWCSVRKTRYGHHDVPFLRAFLAPHDQVVTNVFGTSVEDLLSAIHAVAEAHATGLVKAYESVETIHRQFFERLGSRTFSTPEEMGALMDEFGLSAAMHEAGGRLMGDDLFDLQKLAAFPVALLDELSWEPGQDADFLSEGEYSGWPLRLPSIKKRPFLKIGGRYYCHLTYGLVDNVYRHLQKAITRRVPEYFETWKVRQQEVAETLPINLLQKILPGTKALRSVYYQWPPTPAKDKNWCEADALLFYDDHLIVAEMKAGAFAYTSPATDFQAYLASVKTLIRKPAEQSKRLLDYLNSGAELPLYQLNEHNEKVEVVRLRKDDWRIITTCGLTLDNFTHLAAQAHQLQALGVELKGFPFWSIAIDDLMVFADIFDSPTVFAHFLEQRQVAIATPRFSLMDEVDHIGMYLQYNHYAGKVSEAGDSKVVWHGYSTVIDTYYYELQTEDHPKKPQQVMPALLKSILNLLDASTAPGRARAGSALLNYGEEGRAAFATNLEKALVRQREAGRLQPLLVGQDNFDITVCSSLPDAGLVWDRNEALEHAKISLTVSRKEQHLLFLLTFNAQGSPTHVDWDFVSLESLSEPEVEALTVKAASLRQRRLAKEVSSRGHGKIGRNEHCPCGSGLKFKKCCGKGW